MDKELDEALKWCADGAALWGDDVIDSRYFRFTKVLSEAVRSSLSTIRAQEEEIAGLRAKQCPHSSHVTTTIELIAASQKSKVVDWAEDAEARAEQAESSLAAERAKVAELRADMAEQLRAWRALSKNEKHAHASWIKAVDRAEAAEDKVAALEKDLGRAREALRVIGARVNVAIGSGSRSNRPKAAVLYAEIDNIGKHVARALAAPEAP